ncbi:MAG: hypothetical protein BWY31_04430 [Lentisphaerae bacterium ADurb.Bin242]|nr:MAG: hypothetical protein BWY31_04430 [Lentisphaerae bacterium ADurb.Bin242]
MRQLAAMVHSKGKFEWNIAAHWMALQINLNRDPKKMKAVNPDDLNPYVKKPKKEKIMLRDDEFGLLEGVFCGSEHPKDKKTHGGRFKSSGHGFFAMTGKAENKKEQR